MSERRRKNPFFRVSQRNILGFVSHQGRTDGNPREAGLAGPMRRHALAHVKIPLHCNFGGGAMSSSSLPSRWPRRRIWTCGHEVSEGALRVPGLPSCSPLVSATASGVLSAPSRGFAVTLISPMQSNQLTSNSSDYISSLRDRGCCVLPSNLHCRRNEAACQCRNPKAN